MVNALHFSENDARLKTFRIGAQVFRLAEELDVWEIKQKTLCQAE